MRALLAQPPAALRRAQIRPAELELGAKLGGGSFGEVLAARWRGTPVALKLLHRCNLTQAHLAAFKAEAELMLELRHPNVVRLHEVIDDPIKDKLYLILDYVPGGPIMGGARTHPPLDEARARWLFRDIVCGLGYLHFQGVVHQDLKPENILLANAEPDAELKITDFGLSKILPMRDDEAPGGEGAGTSMELTSQGAGTYWYLPPECFVVGSTAPSISSKVDVWSVGVVLLELLQGTDRPIALGARDRPIIDQQLRARERRAAPQDGWAEGSPPFINAPHRGDPDRYHVEYWQPEWKKLIAGDTNSYLYGIIRQGFDGVLIDGLDAYKFFDGSGEENEEEQ